MLAVGNLAGAVLIWTSDPSRAFIISTTVSLGLVVTAYGYWAVWVRRRHPGNVFLFCQALVDVALVTLLVHLTGGPNSAFPALYILVISGYALLFSFGRGFLVALTAALFYFADVYWGHPVRPGLGFWGQIVIIVGVLRSCGPAGYPTSPGRGGAGIAADRVAPGATPGRRHPPEHPLGRAHHRWFGPARLPEPNGRAPASARCDHE